MNTKPKILIGVTCYRTINARTVFSLVSLIKNEAYDSEFVVEDSCYVHESRNKIVEVAKEKGCSHIFFIDADMALAPDTIEKLLALDKDVAGGVYNFRHLPLEPMVFQKNDEPYLIIPEMLPKEPFKCYAIGTGAMLINMRVFNKIQEPYFFFQMKDGKMASSEDVYFCDKVIENGLEVWADPTLTAGHIGEYIF